MKKRLAIFSFLIAWIGLFAQAADSSFKFALVTDTHAVSYTHLTLPTKRIV